MKKIKKSKLYFRGVLILILIVGVILGLFYHQNKNELETVDVVSEINDYNYYLENNVTRLYKKYYKELEIELKDNKIDEKNYVSLISKLFAIDYYTLNNKITNKNIGGVQFIHSRLKDKFINESSSTVYKYVKNNLYGNRKQNLPEVNYVEIKKISKIKYENNDYRDDSGYEVIVKINYVEDYGYPDEINLKLIHEDNKIVIVEIK